MAGESLAGMLKLYVWKGLGDKEKFVFLPVGKGVGKGLFASAYVFPAPGSDKANKYAKSINDCLEELDERKKLTKKLKENFSIFYFSEDDKINPANKWGGKVHTITNEESDTDFVISIDDGINKAIAMLEGTDAKALERKKKRAATTVNEKKTTSNAGGEIDDVDDTTTAVNGAESNEDDNLKTKIKTSKTYKILDEVDNKNKKLKNALKPLPLCSSALTNKDKEDVPIIKIMYSDETIKVLDVYVYDKMTGLLSRLKRGKDFRMHKALNSLKWREAKDSEIEGINAKKITFMIGESQLSKLRKQDMFTSVSLRSFLSNNLKKSKRCAKDFSTNSAAKKESRHKRFLGGIKKIPSKVVNKFLNGSDI